MKKKTIALIMAVLAVVLCFSLAACGDKPDATEPTSDFEYIKEKGEMIIGYTEFAPMNYIDAEGNFVGFETEFAKAVCEELGVEAKFQKIDWKAKEHYSRRR